MAIDTLMVYVGIYDEVADAEADYKPSRISTPRRV